MTSWIATYIAEKKVEDKGRGSVRSEAPFAEGGKINIFSTDFQRWVEATYGEQLTTHYTTDMMRIVGAKPVVVNIGSGDKHTSRSAWQIPLVLLENWRVGGDSSSD